MPSTSSPAQIDDRDIAGFDLLPNPHRPVFCLDLVLDVPADIGGRPFFRGVAARNLNRSERLRLSRYSQNK